MHGLLVTDFGGPEVLEWTELPDPVPVAGEALVQVRAFTVMWADLLERKARYPGGPQPPYVGGHEFMGEVVAHGPGTAAPPVGTRVFGTAPHAGAGAELVALPARWLHPVPDGLGDIAAATLVSGYMTAEVGIRCFARLTPGESVLVHAAAGGLGSASLQLARAHGAGTIVATAGSPEKVERIRAWGVDVAVDYTTEDFVAATLEATGGAGVDVVLESVGGDVLGRTFDCVAPGGRLVCMGASSGTSTNRFRLQTLFEKGISVSGFTLGAWVEAGVPMVAEAAAYVAELADSGAIEPVIAGVFAPEQIREVHRFVEGREAVGRVVVALVPT